MKLETDRLILRNLEERDIPYIHEYANNLNVSRHLAKVPHPYSEDDARFFYDLCVEDSGQKENIRLAIEPKDLGHFVGVISIDNIDDFNKMGVLGYWLGEPFWGKGYTTEAGKAIVDYAFKDRGLARINVSAYVGNKGSNGVIKKLGFKFEGSAEKAAKTLSEGRYCDVNRYGLINPNFDFS